MKNLIIGILAISTLVLAFMQIKDCSSKPNNFSATGRAGTAQSFDSSLEVLFSQLPASFSAESSARIIDVNVAKAIISSNIPQDPQVPTSRDATYTSSAFFSFLDLFVLLRDYYKNPPPNLTELFDLGVRVYIGKYDVSKQEIRQHLGTLLPDYQNRQAIVLQLMDHTNTVFKERLGVPGEYVTINLGQLCPPKCPTAVRADDIFWVPTFP